VSCPFSPKELSAHVDGELGEGIDAKIQHHLQHCVPCAQVVASFELISTTLRQQPQVQMRRSVVSDVCRSVAAHRQRPLRCRKALLMASALLDGELPAAQADRVRAHVSTCEPCEREFQLMRTCVRVLGEREAIEPPPRLRPRILGALAAVPPGRALTRIIPRVPVWRTAAALGGSLAVAAAVALAVFSVPWGQNGSRQPLRPELIAQQAPVRESAQTVTVVEPEPAPVSASAPPPAATREDGAAPAQKADAQRRTRPRVRSGSLVVKRPAPPLAEKEDPGTLSSEVADAIPENTESTSLGSLIVLSGDSASAEDSDGTAAHEVDSSGYDYLSMSVPDSDTI